MSRPRVLLDARKARDFGIGTYVTGLLGGLAALDRFDLLAVVRPGDEALLPSGVEPIRSAAPHYSIRELVAVGTLARGLRPDLFHAPHYVVPFRPPATTVVTVHDLMHLSRPEHASPVKRLYATTMLRRAVGAAARLIAVSEHTRRELVSFDPRAAGRTTVIPDGVDPRFFTVTGTDVERMRARLGPYVLFLGNDKPHKNLDGLFAAFGTARPAGHRLVLAGGAAERRESRRAAAAAAGLSDALVDLGVVPADDVPPLVAAASALVLPSLTEGFGLPVLEAQAAGTPVVCSDRGGLPEAAGDAALLVDPTDRTALAEAIARAVTDQPLRERLSRSGRARAAGFSWRRVAERTAGLYDEVLGR